MGLCELVLLMLIILIALIVLIFYFKYRAIVKNVSNIGNTIDTSFNSIRYPREMPSVTGDQYDINLSRLGTSSVMSTINAKQGVDPRLPAYLTIVKPLPNYYGVIMKPTSGFDYIISFRGTLSHQDVVSDLKWVQIEYFGLGKVHKGFAEIASEVYPFIDIPANSNVLITGHSLGASVAEIVATRIAKEKKVNVNLYITARPLTGDLTWENNVDKYTNRYIVINKSDDIPQLPLPTMVKDKVGYGYIPAPMNRTIFFDFQTGNIGNNHNPLSYHFALYGGTKPFQDMWYIPIDKFTQCQSS